ncbi:fatty alcohol:caffeoyl-CoA acyltransferase-like [Neltuma alba]|uniref:fatty alcohol:caffeoyl-CoA acyltransferase-like n=1 Tax=Neltuma alba TaxID=207710 RepID=UPI0010A47DBF|nr:fatty alcohol:caffeoyl-CoA acyltransferase-like [Prosopis alba]XP_028778157.1 fatty alcohol:caffeoyl-CoA acyltransferase-like [Prosopis alba]
MGTICQEVPPLPQDLKVRIQNSCMVFPSKQTERRSMFLSNIDKVLNFDVETVHFFASQEDFPPDIVAERLKRALADALVPYDFFAGRLKLNSETGRLEIDCNGAGAGFVVASSDLELDQIGDLVYPNPAFAQLVHKNKDFLKPGDQPLCVFQLTSFNCGGFAIGISTSHTTVDGISFKIFLDNLAAFAANKPLAVTPSHDRHLLAARSPPRVPFSHPELLNLGNLPVTGPESGVFEASSEHLDFKIFRLTAHNINHLKAEAKANATGAARITGFNVVTALVWRCKALSAGDDPNRSSTMLYAVDIRSRLNPPLPKAYAGNAVLTAYATAKCEELKRGPFGRLVETVSEGAVRMTDEYARSVIDWGELYHGFPNGEVLVSSWWRLGFAEVEYPWGKPRYSCPVVYHRKDIILFFPPDDEAEGGGGVNVLVALPPKEMQKFLKLFHEFLN